MAQKTIPIAPSFDWDQKVIMVQNANAELWEDFFKMASDNVNKFDAQAWDMFITAMNIAKIKKHYKLLIPVYNTIKLGFDDDFKRNHMKLRFSLRLAAFTLEMQEAMGILCVSCKAEEISKDNLCSSCWSDVNA